MLSPFSTNVKRKSQSEAFICNKLTVQINDDMFVPYVSSHGILSKLLKL
jgi:hypothetical protein